MASVPRAQASQEDRNRPRKSNSKHGGGGNRDRVSFSSSGHDSNCEEELRRKLERQQSRIRASEQQQLWPG